MRNSKTREDCRPSVVGGVMAGYPPKARSSRTSSRSYTTPPAYHSPRAFPYSGLASSFAWQASMSAEFLKLVMTSRKGPSSAIELENAPTGPAPAALTSDAYFSRNTTARWRWFSGPLRSLMNRSSKSDGLGGSAAVSGRAVAADATIKSRRDMRMILDSLPMTTPEAPSGNTASTEASLRGVRPSSGSIPGRIGGRSASPTGCCRPPGAASAPRSPRSRNPVRIE